MASFLLFAILYSFISIGVFLIIYMNRSYVVLLHYLFLITVIIDCLFYALSFIIKLKINKGSDSNLYINIVASYNFVYTFVTSAMKAMNALLGLLLGIGYQTTNKYKEHYKKIYFAIAIYFTVLCLSVIFETPSEKLKDNKYGIFTLVFTIGIIATISLFII